MRHHRQILWRNRNVLGAMGYIHWLKGDALLLIMSWLILFLSDWLPWRRVIGLTQKLRLNDRRWLLNRWRKFAPAVQVRLYAGSQRGEWLVFAIQVLLYCFLDVHFHLLIQHGLICILQLLLFKILNWPFLISLIHQVLLGRNELVLLHGNYVLVRWSTLTFSVRSSMTGAEVWGAIWP